MTLRALALDNLHVVILAHHMFLLDLHIVVLLCQGQVSDNSNIIDNLIERIRGCG